MECESALLLYQGFRRDDVVDVMRCEVDRVRQEILAGTVTVPDCRSPHFFSKVRDELERRAAPELVRVINATGVVLHTNLGRSPLAPQAVAAIQAAAGYCNLEYDLERRERGSRYSLVDEIVCRLTGAEASLVVNNCAAAVLLTLTALAKDGDVLASRGELVEIGGSFRMPDVITQCGARLVEVGCTNKTHLRDFEQAIGERSRVLLKSHPGNYRIVGFSAQPERRALAQLASERGLVFVEDLGSGALTDLARHGLPDEPTVQQCVSAGAGVVMFSADKLLGGPQAGIIVGKKEYIDRLKAHPLLRALRIDKLSLAALEATLALYETPAPPEQNIPVLRMLTEQKSMIARRARKLARALAKLPLVSCTVEAGVSLAGGGALADTQLPTYVLRLRVGGLSADRLARTLARQRPALVGRIEDDAFIMDLRTIAAGEVAEVVQLISSAIQ